MDTVFQDQVSLASLVHNLVYASGVVGAIMVLVGLLLADAGSTRRKNLFNSTIEKVIGFFIGFTVYYVIGFALWAAQFYVMEGATFGDSIADWWLGGAMTNALAQYTDPAVFPDLNTFQIFIFFLACFAGLINVLLHFSVSERMKASAYFITAAVATVVSSFLSYLTWGPVGPLTNPGFHDFFGVGFVYMFPAAMALVFLWKLGPRPGMFSAHQKVSTYVVPNLALATCGIILVFGGLPMVILSCLFFFDPGGLAVSVTMADSSVGVALNNYGLAWAGGALSGAAIAYKTRKYAYALLGPLAGYVAGASGMDVYVPWQMFIVALIAPFVTYGVYEMLMKRQVDEHKLIPLFLGAGTFGMIMLGIFKSGTPRSGYFGVEEGAYAFQSGQISLLMQIAGVATVIGFGIVTALVLAFILERTIGLKIDEEDQAEGLDSVVWGLETDVATQADHRVKIVSPAANPATGDLGGAAHSGSN